MRLISRHVSSHQVVIMLSEAERIRRWAIYVVTSLLCQTLGIWTSWTFLSSARAQPIIVVAWSKTTLASLISFLCARALTRHSFPTSHDVTRLLHAVVLIHLVVKSSRPNWPTRLENAKLLLV